MANSPLDTVSIGEAAELLGVHRNTVRNRIKAGRYKAHKVVTPQGETYAIELASLDVTPHSTPYNAAQSQVHDTVHKPSQERTVTAASREEQSLALVQSLLAPFIAELGATKEELGATRAERDHERTARVAAEAKLEEALAEIEILRAIPTQVGSRAIASDDAPAVPDATEPVYVSPNTLQPVAPHPVETPPRNWRARLPRLRGRG